MAAPRFRLFHVPGTRSMRIIWLCAELDEPLEVVPIDFAKEARFTPAWLARNPVGKVPAMEVDGSNMFESGAMVEAILDRVDATRGTRSSLRPAIASEAHLRYLQWSWFAEATFARPLGDMAQHTRIKPPAERLPAVVDDGRARARLCVTALDQALQDSTWILGDTFSGADIMLGYSLMLAHNFAVFDAADRHVAAYFDRLRARPGYQRAVG